MDVLSINNFNNIHSLTLHTCVPVILAYGATTLPLTLNLQLNNFLRTYVCLMFGVLILQFLVSVYNCCVDSNHVIKWEQVREGRSLVAM